MLVDHWIDIHAHFYPPESHVAREHRLTQMRHGYWNLDEPPTWSLDWVMSYMNRTGIQMQMLSNIPKALDALRDSNDYGASLVCQHPARLGLLAALPTDDADAALAEAARAYDELDADGFAVTCHYNGTHLGDPKLDPLWADLDHRHAVVFAHPDAYAPGTMGRPAAVMEVAFETARTFTDMLYAGVFRRYPNIRFVAAHCGGALPALSGRLLILGHENWVPNPNRLTPTEMRQHLRRLYLDTAATAPNTIAAALAMTTPDRLVYGSDCGVPCTTDATMDANIAELRAYVGLTDEEVEQIGRNALTLFPKAAARIEANAAMGGDAGGLR